MSDTDEQQTGSDDQQQQSGEQQGQTEQDAGQGQQQSSDTGSGTEQQAASEKVEDLPDWAQRIIRDTRKEAADNRAGRSSAEQQHKAVLDSIATALGLKKDEPLDPKALQAQLADSNDELYTMRVERALNRAAKHHGADEDLVTAVLAHQGKLDDLDPTDSKFADELDALVKAAVDANPKLKAAQAAAASGVDGAGGSGEKTTGGAKSVDDLRKLLKG